MGAGRRLGVVVLFLAGIVYVAAGSAGAAESACSEGPVTSADGSTVTGSACADTIVVESPEVEEVLGGGGNDVIYVDPEVEVVNGGSGDDVIYGELEGSEGLPTVPHEPAPSYEPEPAPPVAPGGGEAAASTYTEIECAPYTGKGEYCYGGPGSQKLIGGEGDDTIFGQRGNDAIYGEGGQDALYGGIGDDKAYGGPNNDLVTGGFGTDVLDGSNGNDLVRGDATGDVLKDQGGTGVDTVSFATAGSPGFKGAVGNGGFPGEGDNEERGVSVNLNGGTGCPGYQACDNSAIFGGGNDEIEAEAFENVIGSPFADLIVGSKVANHIYGGGGADAILGAEGNDTLYGGADGDYIEGGADTDTGEGEAGTDNCAGDVENRPNCEGSGTAVKQRDREKISVGIMVPSLPSQVEWAEAYMLGSTKHDEVNVTYTSGNRTVVFKAVGTSATFDESLSVRSKGCTYASTEVSCLLPAKPDSVLLAGFSGDDLISISGFDPKASPVILGGEGADTLYGSGTTEDVIVDGPGSFGDKTFGFKFDDALVNYLGVDNLQGGLGSDLLISATVCEGDTLQGAESENPDGEDRNNASWALLPEASGGVVVDLAAGKAGVQSGGECGTSGTPSKLLNIDDLEGSNQADVIHGDGKDNSLFGRTGIDELLGEGGNDFINSAEDGAHDNIGGGVGTEDECKFDKGVDSHTGCEIEIPIE